MSTTIETLLKEKIDNNPSVPTIFDLSNKKHEEEVVALFEEGKIQVTIDDYEEEQLELFGVNNPSKVYTPTFKVEFKTYYEALKSKKPLREDGNWAYFPWSYTLVHILK